MPIASAFAKYFPAVGFDVDEARVSELIDGYDRTAELSTEVPNALPQLTLSSNPTDTAKRAFYILPVPTPVHETTPPAFAPPPSARPTPGPSL